MNHQRDRSLRTATPDLPLGRVIDLSLPIGPLAEGVEISTAKSIARDGWNASTLSLYSHSGTHMDAPCHFLDAASGIDQLALDACFGPAKVIALSDISPRESISVDRVFAALDAAELEILPGDRVLMRTDWYRRCGTESYRNDLPRISLALAEWFVERQISLLGVEPPSVADVRNLPEVTEIHRALFDGGVIIVEGLANLDRLSMANVYFIALPLRIVGGDGCPVRAVAIETV